MERAEPSHTSLGGAPLETFGALVVGCLVGEFVGDRVGCLLGDTVCGDLVGDTVVAIVG